MRSKGRIVVIGAGPTGLGAAYRLEELGYDDYEIYEAENSAGGLSSSYTDEAGFTWDLGGHVHFSHYPYYDQACRRALGREGLITHDRKSYVHTLGRFVPYPFQNNIRYLPLESALECLVGIAEANYLRSSPPKNFLEWMRSVFGKGIARLFMEPYNLKVWAHPLDDMSFSWLGERVSVIGLEGALRSILSDDGKAGWGPNNVFRFPREGGTGLLFTRLGEMAGERLKVRKRLVSMEPAERVVRFDDGGETTYDRLISTIPVDRLASMVKAVPQAVRNAAAGLVHNGCIVVGVGLRGSTPSNRHWIYFPEERFPFHRITYLSNYSPAVVPGCGGPYASIMCETTFSTHRPVPTGNIEDATLEALVAAGMLSREDLKNVISVTKRVIGYAYPVPTLDRDERLQAIHRYLEPLGIFSRGRFGAYRYEVGNMDHSFMQGVEAVNRILFNKKESLF